MIETIFAPSSGGLPSAVAIVRVSGPSAGQVVESLTGRAVPTPRKAVLRHVRDEDGGVIDEALVLFWRGPASFTGEDVVEFHLHGGRAVLAKMLAVLGRFPACRPAEAGEFTRRAFLNGRLDLTAIEALGDLVASETEAQRRAAVGQLAGDLRRRCDVIAARLLRVRALLEAAIDFSDESDVPAEIVAEAMALVEVAGGEVRTLLATGRPAERLRDGLTVVLAGAPNAGKSSLLNALAGRDVAIVSEEAGTTRDILAVDLDLSGYPVRVIDTAGLREAAGVVEREGVRRARDRAATADLVLLLVPTDDASAAPDVDTTAPIWRLRSKADLGPTVHGAVDNEAELLAITTVSPGGLDELLARMTAFAASHLRVGEGALLLQARQRGLLEACAESLEAAGISGDDIELVAEEIRRASDALAGITGAVSTEAMLGEIFGRFCIGK
jgi:tRNA modification GTPase